jgi:hypothetical protein
MKNRILYIILFFQSLLFAQDSTFIKTAYAGSKVMVPKGKIWVVEKAFINAGDGYNVKINTAYFKEYYTSKDAFIVPSYVSEMEMLTTKNAIWYQLYIKQPTNTSESLHNKKIKK